MDTPTGDIMGPGKIGWQEFRKALTGLTGLNLHPDGHGGILWYCPHDIELPIARRVLEPMEGENVEASILFFHCRGAFCDCEILWNIDEDDELQALLDDAIEQI